MNATNLIGLI